MVPAMASQFVRVSNVLLERRILAAASLTSWDEELRLDAGEPMRFAIEQQIRNAMSKRVVMRYAV